MRAPATAEPAARSPVAGDGAAPRSRAAAAKPPYRAPAKEAGTHLEVTLKAVEQPEQPLAETRQREAPPTAALPALASIVRDPAAATRAELLVLKEEGAAREAMPGVLEAPEATPRSAGLAARKAEAALAAKANARFRPARVSWSSSGAG
jgi:hypothetical protein